jgi:hypothetical protein
LSFGLASLKGAVQLNAVGQPVSSLAGCVGIAIVVLRWPFFDRQGRSADYIFLAFFHVLIDGACRSGVRRGQLCCHSRSKL